MLTDLLAWLSSLFNSLQSLLYWFTDKLFFVFQTCWNYIVDGFCFIVESSIRLIDFQTNLFSASASFAGLPPQMIYVLNAVGIPQMFTIITAAILIRVSLNLIPGMFTRV